MVNSHENSANEISEVEEKNCLQFYLLHYFLIVDMYWILDLKLCEQHSLHFCTI